ncbi:hypothetical protein QCA50_007307 [Cerrena zonata]|uniref:Uncharacterized protein n=1 Tax=Cerrena zonata TaxID=2478898 RepID=A0AAW0GK85_9APHY
MRLFNKNVSQIYQSNFAIENILSIFPELFKSDINKAKEDLLSLILDDDNNNDGNNIEDNEDFNIEKLQKTSLYKKIDLIVTELSSDSEVISQKGIYYKVILQETTMPPTLKILKDRKIEIVRSPSLTNLNLKALIDISDSYLTSFYELFLLDS